MPKTKLNFRNLTVPEKIARAQQIVAALTGNANFPAPHPPLTEVTAAINVLETAANAAHAARLEARRTTATQTRSEDDLSQIISRLVSHVESVAGGDESKILSAGLDLRGEGAPAEGDPEAPETLSGETGYHDGEVNLKWGSVRGARSYVVEYCRDGEADTVWTHAGVTARPEMFVGGLQSGARYRFRVAAVTLRGQSPWSNHVVKTAP